MILTASGQSDISSPTSSGQQQPLFTFPINDGGDTTGWNVSGIYTVHQFQNVEIKNRQKFFSFIASMYDINLLRADLYQTRDEIERLLNATMFSVKAEQGSLKATDKVLNGS